jgi:selenocysteine lyase/cysteine desulfurase
VRCRRLQLRAHAANALSDGNRVGALAIRVGFIHYNTTAEVDALVAALTASSSIG